MSINKLPKMLLVLATSLALYAGCDQGIPETPPRVTAAENPARILATLPNFTALVKSQGPAVVNISSTRKVRGTLPMNPFHGLPGLKHDDPFYDFFKHFGWGNGLPQEFRSESMGSGFIIDLDGHILTNSHVVEGADEVMVGLTDRREFKAKVIGIDKRSDVALLKISAKNLPVVNIGDAGKLEVGEWVVAIGAPFGFANSVTQGIVSAKGRDLPGQNIIPFIQTDVAINPGNSGGPLFNMNGEVVGINSQIVSRSGGSMGISFAIPIDVAIKVKDQLLKHGSVRRGKLGVTIQNLSPDLAESFAIAKASGALIASVDKGGPAERAGIQAGDVVLQFDGKEVASSGDLARFVAEASPGASARLKVWRNGAARDISVRLGEADVATAEEEPKVGSLESDRLGLSLRELGRAERQTYQTEGAVLVEAVEGFAAAAGIQPGDIILSVNNRTILNLAQLRSELSKTRNRVALLIQRGVGTKIYISLRLKDE